MCHRRQNSTIDRAPYGLSKFWVRRIPKTPRHPERHVGVAGKIAVELHGKEVGAERKRRPLIRPDRSVDRLDHRTGSIRHHRLLEQSPREQDRSRAARLGIERESTLAAVAADRRRARSAPEAPSGKNAMYKAK